MPTVFTLSAPSGAIPGYWTPDGMWWDMRYGTFSSGPRRELDAKMPGMAPLFDLSDDAAEQRIAHCPGEWDPVWAIQNNSFTIHPKREIFANACYARAAGYRELRRATPDEVEQIMSRKPPRGALGCGACRTGLGNSDQDRLEDLWRARRGHVGMSKTWWCERFGKHLPQCANSLEDATSFLERRGPVLGGLMVIGASILTGVLVGGVISAGMKRAAR